METAKAGVYGETTGFDETREAAYSEWNRMLNAIEVEQKDTAEYAAAKAFFDQLCESSVKRGGGIVIFT